MADAAIPSSAIVSAALRLFFAQAIINVITLFPEHYAATV
jgi:hypothetical protein